MEETTGAAGNVSANAKTVSVNSARGWSTLVHTLARYVPRSVVRTRSALRALERLERRHH